MTEQLTLIFANGDLDDLAWAKQQASRAARIIAADGGLGHIQALGLVPDLLIGDLDSVTPEQLRWVEEQGVEVRRFPVNKDETDLELALTAALESHPDRIIITAAIGDRLDQTLANIFLLNLPLLADVDVRVGDGGQEVILVRNAVELTGEVGDVVSLLSLTPIAEGITTRGLEYPLDDETLSCGQSRGVSNRMTARNASVALRSGTLICIHDRKGK